MAIKEYAYQIELAEKISKRFNDYRYVVMSCPCGYGKSGVAFQLHRQNIYGHTLILNHNKILVDQYENLFAGRNDVVCIKGKSNYPCALKPEISCEEGLCQIKPNYKCGTLCEYYNLKQKFDLSPLAVTNYQFLLSNLDFGTYTRKNNTMLICDECHNIDSIMSGFRRVSINSELINLITNLSAYVQRFKIKDSILVGNLSYIINKYKLINEDNYKDMFSDIFRRIEEIISFFTVLNEDKKIKDDKAMVTVNSLNRYYKGYSKYKCDTRTEYVFSMRIDDSFDYSLTPLSVGAYFPELLSTVTDNALLMSGTIIDVNNLIRNLGLPRTETTFMDVPSLFKKENRPVLFCNIAPLNNRNTTPESSEFKDIVGAILGLVTTHKDKNESGVLFTPSYKLAKDIYAAIESKISKLGYKIFMNKATEDAISTLEAFTKSQGLRLLISPSFEEGVNFNDDISRFQIIVKTPYLYIGDKRVSRKMELDKGWYNSATFCRIIQSASRSVRSKDDYAVTYILDTNATRLYRSVKAHCPSWFNESVEIMD